MDRCLIIFVIVSFVLSVQITNARHIKHKVRERWYTWHFPGLEVVNHKIVEKHHEHRLAERDAPPFSGETEEQATEEKEHEESDELSRLPEMSKEVPETDSPKLVRIPLEGSVAAPILPPGEAEDKYFQDRAGEILTNIGLPEGFNGYLQKVGVLPVMPEPHQPIGLTGFEGPLKIPLLVEEHVPKELPPQPPPPPPPVPEHVVHEEIKRKEQMFEPHEEPIDIEHNPLPPPTLPLFRPEIKHPKIIEPKPPIVEILPPHPEVVIPHVIQPEIRPQIIGPSPPEVLPIPAPPLPPLVLKPPEVVEITQTEIKPPVIEPPPEVKPPPLAGPIATGTRWVLFFGNMLLKALTEIISGARTSLVQYTVAEE